MRQLKKILKMLLPPIIVDLFKSNKPSEYGFFTGYQSFAEAASHAGGYNSEEIFHKVKNALLKVKSGEAVFERDSVLFQDIIYSWPLLTGLLFSVALNKRNALNILDFGGSLGSSYFQNRRFLEKLNHVNWNIVEQAHFIDCGKTYFADDRLRFFYTIEECFQNQKPETLLLASVLQYFEKVDEILIHLLSFNFSVIIIDRTPFTTRSHHIPALQKVPPSIYNASYPAWLLSKDRIYELITNNGYYLHAEFDAIGGRESLFEYKGAIFIRNGIK